MALNFPISPNIGDTYAIGNTTWQWNGTAWAKQSAQVLSLTITETLLVTTSTQSTSTDTGALRVVGGVGVGGNLNIGGYVAATSGNFANIAATSATIANLYISSSTQALSTTTGALVVAGGMAVQRDVWIGGVLHTAGGYVLTTSSFNNSLSSGSDIQIDNIGGNAIRISNTSTLDTVTARGNSTTNIIRILNTTNTVSTSTGAVQIAGGLAVGKDIYSAGNVYVIGQVYSSYSDRRLKTGIEPITGAVDKIMQLNGMTYVPNTLAKSLGFNSDQRLAGVFADEVECVLPEAVASVAVNNNENYKTVQYEKIVPLLIEAIKEQQIEIEKLKSNNCVGCSCKG